MNEHIPLSLKITATCFWIWQFIWNIFVEHANFLFWWFPENIKMAYNDALMYSGFYPIMRVLYYLILFPLIFILIRCSLLKEQTK